MVAVVAVARGAIGTSKQLQGIRRRRRFMALRTTPIETWPSKRLRDICSLLNRTFDVFINSARMSSCCGVMVRRYSRGGRGGCGGQGSDRNVETTSGIRWRRRHTAVRIISLEIRPSKRLRDMCSLLNRTFDVFIKSARMSSCCGVMVGRRPRGGRGGLGSDRNLETTSAYGGEAGLRL